MDLTKLLSEKSKALLRKNNPTSNTQDTAAKRRQQGTSQSVNDESPANKPMLEFCRELLVEMRKDRDVISDNLVDINRQLGALPGLERDIREMRADINQLSSQVVKAETHASVCSKFQSDIHARIHQVEVMGEQMSLFRRGVDHTVGELRGMFATSTTRMNNVELTHLNSIAKWPMLETPAILLSPCRQ